MAKVAKKYREELARLKKNVESFHDYFRKNYDEFVEANNYLHVTQIDGNRENYLSKLNRPAIQVNILEAYANRILGEFSKHEVGFKVRSKAGTSASETVNTVEDHLRSIDYDSKKSNMQYQTFNDMLKGYSVVKVFTDYESPMSFAQNIRVEKIIDPTLAGFDPTARRRDKGDGDYCYEVIPMRVEEVEKMFGSVSKDTLTLGRNVGGFSWSYQNVNEDIVLLVDYYEKKHKKEQIVLLTTNETMTLSDYNKLLEMWESEGIVSQPPQIIGKPRTTTIPRIVRYQFVENQVLAYEETSYRKLPFVFFDGNSTFYREKANSSMRQHTKSFFDKAKGIQDLKNYCAQSLANELENMSTAKIIAPVEAIPKEYLQDYKNPQTANAYLYRQFLPDNPAVRLDPPQMLPPPQISKDIIGTFQMADMSAQNILGSYEPNIGQSAENEMSGVAIQEMVNLSNAATMPYYVSFMAGMQSVAELVIDLIPLYYRTPRSIPIVDSQGNRSFAKINQQGGINLAYDPDDLDVEVTASVSFESQQRSALNTLSLSMNSSPMLQEFISTKCLDLYFGNYPIRGGEEIEERAKAYMEEMQMAAQAASQNPSPEQQFVQIEAQRMQNEGAIEQQKIQLNAATEQTKAQLKQSQLELDKQKNQIEILKVLADIKESMAELGIKKDKQIGEAAKAAVDSALKINKAREEAVDDQIERGLDAIETVQEATEEMPNVEEIVITEER